MSRVIQLCGRLTAASHFQNAILAVIMFNALVIGLETYEGLVDRTGNLFNLLNEICLGIFTVEVVIRLVAYGGRPDRFFRRGWNIFDFTVVAVSYLPFVQASATLLRLARLLRVARLLEVMPGLRVVIIGISRSLKPIAGLAALTFFLLYVYGIIGWILYHEQDPKHWGSIGDALLTLFQVLTLEGWNEVLAQTMEINSWSWIYMVSFVLLATFVVLNIVIAVVVNSMDEARAEEERRLRLLKVAEDDHDPSVQLENVRTALDELETKLEHIRAGWT